MLMKVVKGLKLFQSMEKKLWSKSNYPALLPSIYKTSLGRPKKLRRKEADEYVNHTKLSKKNSVMKCSSCN